MNSKTIVFLIVVSITVFFMLLINTVPPATDAELIITLIAFSCIAPIPALFVLWIVYAYRVYKSSTTIARLVHEQEELWHMSDL